jgi:hypothetical protein
MIEPQEWETWEELCNDPNKARIGVYTGRKLRAEIARRCLATSCATGSYVRACVERFIRANPVDADPRR